MDRDFYLGLAGSGLRLPIGIDLVLHERDDSEIETIIHDGVRLGAVMASAAKRYASPLAMPLMDLTLEKADLLRRVGIADSDVDKFHFPQAPPPDTLAIASRTDALAFSARNQAHIDAIHYIASRTDLLAVGMSIGPFSLMTKLMADPITAIAMAGGGVSSTDDPDVLLAERSLELAEMTIARSLRAQIMAGAKAVMICEPAAGIVYLSPRQIRAGSGIFDQFVMRPNLRIKQQLASAGVDLIFHDCGELTDTMVHAFATRLDPVILSLGSSRNLWDDFRLVPKTTVLFGNLPTKKFYSDTAMSVDDVARLAQELIEHMSSCGHPHILGSECDVLHVPEAAETIRRKVDVMLQSGR